MKLVSYANSVPGINKKNRIIGEKDLILRYFVNGVQTNGDIGILHTENYIYEDSDVGLIQGWVHDKINSPHLILRKNVIDYYTSKNKKVITADANFFLFADKANTAGYLRYSYNGIFPNTGIYCDTQVNPQRWVQISKDMNISISKPKKLGSKILFCLQRNGGWSMNGIDVVDWIVSTVNKIRLYSDRIIVLRPHPGDKNSPMYLNPSNSKLTKLKNIEFSKPNVTIEEDLKNTWCVVNHNSSSVVGPIIYGYPAFVTDPLRSQCTEVAHIDFLYIENPKDFNRQQWVERISMFHWKYLELKNGTCWTHMKKFV